MSFDEIDKLINTLLEHGRDAESIKDQLAYRYQLDNSTAEERIAHVISQRIIITEANRPNPERKKRIRMTGLTDMAIGGGLCFIAVIIFFATLGAGIGYAIIWGGLVVFGMYRFIEGLWTFLRGGYSSD